LGVVGLGKTISAIYIWKKQSVISMKSLAKVESGTSLSVFKADTASLSFYASKADKLVSVSYQGWDASKVVLEGGRCCGGY
jgi:hypothetical protein